MFLKWWFWLVRVYFFDAFNRIFYFEKIFKRAFQDLVLYWFVCLVCVLCFKEDNGWNALDLLDDNFVFRSFSKIVEFRKKTGFIIIESDLDQKVGFVKVEIKQKNADCIVKVRLFN